jgi:hypothetical protein
LLLKRLVVIGLHGWEQKNLLDVVCVSQQHCESVNAHAPSCGRGQPILKSLYESFIEELSFEVASCFGIDLLHECFELDLGVIKLGVSVDELMAICKELETFG